MKSRYVCLSHTLKNTMPCYNGNRNINITNAQSLKNGDTVNSITMTLENHVGTHMDFPKHFYEDGMSLDDYEPEHFIFEKVRVIDIPLDSGIVISAEMVANASGCCTDNICDFLIVRTGYGLYYNQSSYWNDNPGLSLDAAEYIKRSFTNLKAIGVDFISINAYKNKAEGRKAHMKLLEKPSVVIIEDMKLLGLEAGTRQIKRIIAAPLQVSQADGVPCTIYAEFDIKE